MSEPSIAFRLTRAATHLTTHFVDFHYRPSMRRSRDTEKSWSPLWAESLCRILDFHDTHGTAQRAKIIMVDPTGTRTTIVFIGILTIWLKLFEAKSAVLFAAGGRGVTIWLRGFNAKCDDSRGPAVVKHG